MKILFVTSGTMRVAASRYRVGQYLPYLSGRGIKFRAISSISDTITRLSIRSPEFSSFQRVMYYILLYFNRYLRLWLMLTLSLGADIIFLQRVTFPFGAGWIPGALKTLGKKIVFDIDDAIFLPDTEARGIITRFKAWAKAAEVRGIMRISDLIIVENEYIKRFASKYCRNIQKIPGPIDTERYGVRSFPDSPGNGVVIGWIGSPATTGYLNMAKDQLMRVLDVHKNVRIVLVGAGATSVSGGNVAVKEWEHSSEVSDLQSFDIGIMPMPDDKWTKGKLGCKMLQYMAVGVVSVCSYTETNAELITHGKNGYLVNSADEWTETLSMLIKDSGLRRRIGIEGRKTVEEKCSVSVNGPRLVVILEELLKKG